MTNEQQLTVPVDEEKQVTDAKIKTAKKYYFTGKYMLWERLFLDSKNDVTFNNATQSALIAYNLDKDDPKAYSVARTIGHENLTKHHDLVTNLWIEKGLSAGKLLDLYERIIEKTGNVNLLYALAKKFGIELPEYKNITEEKKPVGQPVQINGDTIHVKFETMEQPNEA